MMQAVTASHAHLPVLMLAWLLLLLMMMTILLLADQHWHPDNRAERSALTQHTPRTTAVGRNEKLGSQPYESRATSLLLLNLQYSTSKYFAHNTLKRSDTFRFDYKY